MQTIEEKNKQIVRRFNDEYLAKGDLSVYRELVDDSVINHAAPPNMPNGYNGMLYFLEKILRKGFPDMQVDIVDQVAEGDKVVSRKIITSTHLGPIMGVAATNKKVEMEVMEMIQLKDGKYTGHWGLSTINDVLAKLSSGN